MPEHEGGAAPLAEHVRRRLDTIVDDLMDRQWREVPELWVTDDPSFRDAVAHSTRDNVELLARALRRPPGDPPPLLPVGARLEADAAARHGARIDVLLRTYRLGQQALTEVFLDAIEQGVGGEDPAVAVRQLRAATRAVHTYMEGVMPLVATEYDDERRRLAVDPAIARLRLVEAVLAGQDGAGLDYDTAGHHAAIVSADPGAEQAVAAVAAEIGSGMLAVRATDGRCWAWLTDPAPELGERLRRHGVREATGLGGLEGTCSFAAAHRQAHVAQRIARSRRDDVVDLHGAALEALALGDAGTAWEVGRAELGPLTDGVRHDHLVRTLEAWFATRESVAGAARALGVAPRTVSYRLRRAETLLGHPIAARRVELEAALRLRRLFGATPPPA